MKAAAPSEAIDVSAALNAEDVLTGGPRGSEVGSTFADALRLLKRARYAAVAVRFSSDLEAWGYVRVSRAMLARWLADRQLNMPPAALHSVLSAPYDEELWLFVGVGYDKQPAGGPS